jgi:UDP-N-acetylmuramyl pentapeptide synthase
VKYSPRQILDLLRTPAGRSIVAYGVHYRAWPLVAAAARLHRRRLGARTRFVAVVGSFGKTTTARAVRAALALDPDAHHSANSWTHLARAVLRVRSGTRHAVLEAGINGPGQMVHYAALIRPDVTVVTSIGSEHNRSLRTLADTRHEKAEMVRALPAHGIAVLNGDDPNVLWMRTQTAARVVTFGLGSENDVVGSDVRLDWPHGTRLTVTVHGERRELRSRLLGEKMAGALLAAVAVGVAEGRALDDVLHDVAAVAPTPGRLHPVPLASGAWLLRDDYKSGLETIEAALDVLEQIPAARKFVVLGEVAEPVGPQGAIYRALGARLARFATGVLATGWHRRPLASGARRAGLSADVIHAAGPSILDAVAQLREQLAPGDVVLLKGRDDERIERVALALTGRDVRCALRRCEAKVRCDLCPMLERGWPGADDARTSVLHDDEDDASS